MTYCALITHRMSKESWQGLKHNKEMFRRTQKSRPLRKMRWHGLRTDMPVKSDVSLFLQSGNRPTLGQQGDILSVRLNILPRSHLSTWLISPCALTDQDRVKREHSPWFLLSKRYRRKKQLNFYTVKAIFKKNIEQ